MKKYLILALPVLVALAACTKVEVQDTEQQAVTFNVVNYLQQTRALNAYNTEDTFKIVDKENRVINGNSSYRVYEIPSTSNSKYT